MDTLPEEGKPSEKREESVEVQPAQAPSQSAVGNAEDDTKETVIEVEDKPISLEIPDAAENKEMESEPSAPSIPPATSIPLAPITINSTALPKNLIRVAVTDELERLRITSTISQLLDELADCDVIKSKQLVKLSNGYLHQTNKSPLLPSLSVIVEEMMKATVVMAGKQSASLANNVKQGVCALLPEHVKQSKKKLNSTFANIVSIADEMKRGKTAYGRLAERQQRLIKEAEAALQAANVEDEQPGKLTMMMSKIAGERKGMQKYRDILREIDVLESQMQTDARRVNVSRSELEIEIAKSFKLIEELEIERLQVMREGIDRLLLSIDVATKAQLESFEPAEKQLSNLDLRAEIDSFFAKNAQSDTFSLPAAFSSFDLEQEKTQLRVALKTVCAKGDCMSDILDFFQLLAQKLSQCIRDATSAESLGVNGANKVLEKHGFPPLPFERNIFDSGMLITDTAQTLQQELPATRALWELALNVVGSIVDAHSRTIDFYNDETCQQLELIQNRIDMCKKTLVEKNVSAVRAMDTVLQELGKIRTKLTRVRGQIKDKKQLVRNIKGMPEIDGHQETSTSVNAAPAPGVAAETGDMANGSSSAELAQTTSVDVQPAVPSSTPTAVTSSTPTGSTSNSAMSFASAALISKRAMESFGSTLRGAANLKTVVGLETLNDRINRVESQAAVLEEEERQLMEQERLLIVNWDNTLTTIRAELEGTLSITVEIFLVDVDTFKRTLSRVLSWHKEKFEPALLLVKELRENISSNGNEVREDFRIAYENFVRRDNHCDGELFEVPRGIIFEGNKLMRIAEEGDEVDSGTSLSATTGGAHADNNATAAAVASSTESDESSETQPRSKSGEADLSEARNVVPSPARPSQEFDLKKFGLSSSDRVLESYSCALYPKKGLLTHGRMFVTQHFVAFSGWPDTRVLLQICDLQKVEKMNTLMYIPNAVSLQTKESEEYFFGSFIDRDQCFNLIQRLMEVDKTITQQYGTNESVVSRKLEFGYQLSRPAGAPSLSSKFLGSSTPKEASEKTPLPSTSEVVTPTEGDSYESALGDNTLHTFKEVPANFGSIIKNNSLMELVDTKLNMTARDVYQHCWMNASGYENYLTSSGDFDVQKEEWKANSSPSVPEDVSKLSFHFQRNWFFQHPRTTMLMFGPKNAPTQQRQYLFVPFEATVDGHFTPENFAKSKLNKFVILIITQFEGVPMADVFRVLLYQFYENVDGGKCQVRIGLGMHYVKSTMFKSQIISGTKDELVTQLAAWIAHVKKSVAASKPAITASGEAGQAGVEEEEEVSVIASSTVPGGVGSAASSLEGGNPLQQIMQNWVLVAMISVLFLLFLWQSWSARSQISALTARIDELERTQKHLLLDIVSQSMKSSK